MLGSAIRHLRTARTRRPWWRAMPLLLCIVTASAALENPADHTNAAYEDGLARMNRGDDSGAIVQFQQIVSQQPRHLPARLALGGARLKTGDPAGAEKDLRLALTLGGSHDQIFPLLGNALLAQRKYALLLELIKGPVTPNVDTFQIAVLRGRAHYERGEHDAAELEFQQAAASAPERSEPLLGRALVAAAQSRFDAAVALVEQALRLAPNSSEAWFRKGEILREHDDDAGALNAYAQALKIDPNALRVHLARAGVNLKKGDREAALADVQFVARRNPRDLSAAFLRWQIYERAGDAGAQEALTEVSGKLSQYADETLTSEPLLLRIAALVHYARHDLVRADKYLGRYVELRRNDTPMQSLHGEVLLALGDAKAAAEVLGPLYRHHPDKLDIVQSLGQAYLQLGRYSDAEAVFTHAQTLAPKAGAVVTNLALARLGLGKLDGAQTGLADAIAADQGARGAQMLLTVLQFKAGARDRALATVESLAVHDGQDQRVLNLLGVMRAANEDEAGARRAFAQALQIKPDYTPPAYNLARLEFSAGEIPAARARLEALLTRDPHTPSALMALADIALAGGDREGAVNWLEQAVVAQPEAVDAEAQLVALRLALGQDAQALASAERMVERHPENALAVETLAAAKAANHQTDHALRLFRDAARYASFDGPQLMRIATRQAELEDYVEARRTLLKAQNSSASEQADDALVRLEIKVGDYGAAGNRIAALRTDDVGNARAEVMTGELEMQRGDAAAAIKAYRAAQSAAPSTAAAVGLADAMLAAGDAAGAVQMLERWTAQHVDDQDALHALALLYLRMQRLPEAQTLHERLVANAPDDATVLAGLARLYQLAGDKRAREVAERAVAAAPDSPLVLDTLGWILVTQGQAKDGLELLRNALTRDNNPLIRYHLAQALSELGRDSEARSELRKVLKLGQPPALMADVQRYYDALPAE